MWMQFLLLSAQAYSGPVPAKSDVPYLLHANELVSTEVTEVKQSNQKDGVTYTIAEANSPARTPLASPVFLLKADKLDPEKLQAFQLQSTGGHREITFYRKKKSPQAYTFTVKKLDGKLYRLEVNESLPNGEYSVTPSDSNQAFCFAVY